MCVATCVCLCAYAHVNTRMYSLIAVSDLFPSRYLASYLAMTFKVAFC